MHKVAQTFLDLADIDETFPGEDRVLQYVKHRLQAAGVSLQQDDFRNIVATIPGRSPASVAVCGHVDIAAPLNGRKVIVEGDVIKTDGTGLLGGDDKTAVAAMLELADHLHTQKITPSKTIELIFTVGEEAGCKGAIELEYSLVHSKQVLVFDWLSGVNHIVTQSPAYYSFDVTYTGKDAHPAEWQQGKNAGAALMAVAATLPQGQFAPEVIFNIGRVRIGDARNKVPGQAKLWAEARSYDAKKVAAAAKEIEAAFREGLKTHTLDGDIHISNENAAYNLDKQSPLLADALKVLQAMSLEPVYETTYGCFDGNIFAKRGLDVLIMGAGYYNPHSPDEYVKISELDGMLTFLKHFTS